MLLVKFLYALAFRCSMPEKTTNFNFHCIKPTKLESFCQKYLYSQDLNPNVNHMFNTVDCWPNWGK